MEPRGHTGVDLPWRPLGAAVGRGLQVPVAQAWTQEVAGCGDPVACRPRTARKAHDRATTLPTVHRARPPAWGVLNWGRGGMRVLGHGSTWAGPDMAWLLRRGGVKCHPMREAPALSVDLWPCPPPGSALTSATPSLERGERPRHHTRPFIQKHGEQIVKNLPL